MNIAIGCDHHGVALKKQLSTRLSGEGHTVFDAGTNSDEPVDYPDIAGAVSRRVRDGQSDRGILICGSGIGMSIVANKHKGVRGAVCTNIANAELSRRHNDANVLCLSGAAVELATNEQIVETWMATPFDGGRHQRRVDKIRKIEDGSPVG